MSERGPPRDRPEHAGPPDDVPAATDLPDEAAVDDFLTELDQHPGKRPRAAFRRGDEVAEADLDDVQTGFSNGRAELSLSDGRTVTVTVADELEWLAAVDDE